MVEQPLLQKVKDRFRDAVESKKSITQEMQLWLAYYADRQLAYLDRKTRYFVAPSEEEARLQAENRRVKLLQINLCKPAVETVVSNAAKQAPRIFVRPGTAYDDVKKGIAKVATGIMSYECNMQDYLLKHQLCMKWTTITGKCYKIVYPDFWSSGYTEEPEMENVVDETTGMSVPQPRMDREGNPLTAKIPRKTKVSVRIIPPTEAYPAPGCLTMDEMPYFIWAKYTPVDILKDKFKALADLQPDNRLAGTDTMDAQPLIANREKVEDVKLTIEYWEKPTEDNPKGCHLFVCDNKILINEPFPYWNKRKDGSVVWDGYHIVDYDYHTVPSSHWSQGLISSVYPIQKAYNACYSWMMSNIIPTAQLRLMVPKGFLKKAKLKNIPDILEYEPGGEKPGWLPPPPIQQMMDLFLNHLRQEFDTVSGVHSLSMGKLPEQRVSGVALNAMLQIDMDKFASVFEAIEEKERKFGYYILQTYKQFCPERIYEILDPSWKSDIDNFLNDDLDDTDIVVERGSSFPESRAGQMQLLSDLQQYGATATFSPLQKLRFWQAFKTGWGHAFVETESAAVTLAEQENAMLLAGKRPRVSVAHNHDLHIQIHSSGIFDSPQYLVIGGTPVEQGAADHIAEHFAIKGQMMNPPEVQELQARAMAAGLPPGPGQPGNGQTNGVVKPPEPAGAEQGGQGTDIGNGQPVGPGMPGV